MFRYTTLYINAISLFISIIIFFFINFLISSFDFVIYNSSFKSVFELEEKNQNITSESFSSEEKSTYSSGEANSKGTREDMLWYLEIPNINLKAEIEEGTSKEIMEYYIGHFEETSKWNGNIGLAAHNRGYKNNYFRDLKSLKEGDKVYYYYNGNSKEYEVISNFIIEDTNWSVLNESDEDTITLITCVENEPNYRRCVQAKQVDNKN